MTNKEQIPRVKYSLPLQLNLGTKVTHLDKHSPNVLIKPQHKEDSIAVVKFMLNTLDMFNETIYMDLHVLNYGDVIKLDAESPLLNYTTFHYMNGFDNLSKPIDLIQGLLDYRIAQLDNHIGYFESLSDFNAHREKNGLPVIPRIVVIVQDYSSFINSDFEGKSSKLLETILGNEEFLGVSLIAIDSGSDSEDTVDKSIFNDNIVEAQLETK